MDGSRQALVEVSLRRFAVAGREAVGPRDLVKRLGLSPATVFKHFKNRDELFAAVIGRVQAELFAHIEATCPVVPGESGLSMLVRLAEAYGRFLKDGPGPYFEVLREAVHSGGTPSSGGETERELARIGARIVKQFEVLLLLGRLDGSVRPERFPDGVDDMARRVVNVVFGTVRLGLALPRTRNLSLMLTALAAAPDGSIRAA